MKLQLSRSEEILAHSYLAEPDLLAQAIVERRWHDVAVTVAAAEADAPVELASTDPALYRKLAETLTPVH
ncbi:MAG: hypothetical protein EOP84_30215 [Verrucomicrobiaceae bacterium]|nr:MAG: hypothetical protein EOP84_30215 [Verrucomicrobiaceae bacterium]